MTPNAEPIELATVVAALVWLILVAGLLLRWASVWGRAAKSSRPQVNRLMIVIRIVGYSSAVLLSVVVLAAGVLQAVSPRPAQPSEWRATFQYGWFLIAASQILTIGVIEFLTRLVMRFLDREEGPPP